MNVYEEVARRAETLIESYKDDLVKHDQADIVANPGTPFLHFTGSTGTTLIWLRKADQYPAPGEKVPYLFGHAGRQHILEEVTAVVRCLKTLNRQALVLHYDGKESVRSVSQAQAEEIAASYTRSVEKEWGRQSKKVAI